MSSFRQHIRRARQTLHERLAAPALAISGVLPWNALADVPLACTVRVTDNRGLVGELKGTSFHYAESENLAPTIIFMRAHLEPTRNMVVSVEPGVAYRISSVRPHDDLTVIADVTRLSPAEANGLPLAVVERVVGVPVAAHAVFPRFRADALVGSPATVEGEVAFAPLAVEGEAS